jgi:hypothetical protein
MTKKSKTWVPVNPEVWKREHPDAIDFTKDFAEQYKENRRKFG